MKNKTEKVSPDSPPLESSDQGAAGPRQQASIRSEELLAGRTEIQILHRGETYRLSVTRSGKLILHK